MQEFSQCPVPYAPDRDTVRVYFATRPLPGSDGQYVSRPGFVDYRAGDFSRILRVSPKPVLELGARGMFDEFGVMPGCVVANGDRLLMYYSGWTRAASVPYVLGIGVAESINNGESFRRIGDGPILTINVHDPYFVTGPVVRVHEGSWHMWYLSCERWLKLENKLEPIFKIRHASSTDGLNWHREHRNIVSALTENECQDILSPFKLRDEWHAVFAYRDPTASDFGYRFGHARSKDLLSWERSDGMSDLSRSFSGWDSEMVCYPAPFSFAGQQHLFYCGNSFGKTGFGIAILTN
jgi:hypothetical protein